MKKLREAAFRGNLSEMQPFSKQLVQNKKQIDEPGESSAKTALHRAAEGNKPEAVDWLLKHSADPNCIDRNGKTPLHYATQNLNEAMIDRLLEGGAKVLTSIDYKTGTANSPLETMVKLKAEHEKSIKNIDKNNLATNEAKIESLLKEALIINRIIQKIKSIINKEATELAQNPHLNIEAIHFDEFGKFYFGTTKDILKIKNAATSKNISAIDFNSNKEIILSYNGKAVRNPLLMIERQYFTPPLVFFVDHRDPSTFQFILRNLPFLKSLGYSSICFEHDHDKTLAETMAIFKKFIESAPLKPSAEDMQNIKIAKLHLDFFKQLELHKWLKFVGIDAALGNLRSESFKDLFVRPEMSDARETEFARKLVLETDRTNGGTIAIVGLEHNGIQKKLVEYGSSSALSYQYYFYYSRAFFDVEPSKYFLGLDYKFDFPLQKIESSKETAEKERIIKTNILIEILKNQRPLDYVQYLTEDTCDLKILKDHFKVPFVAAVDKDHTVDALLPVKDFKEYQFVTALLYKKLNLEKPIRLQINEKGEFMLVLPRINKENARCIYNVSLAIPNKVL